MQGASRELSPSRAPLPGFPASHTSFVPHSLQRIHYAFSQTPVLHLVNYLINLPLSLIPCEASYCVLILLVVFDPG